MILDAINKVFNLTLASILNVFDIGNLVFKSGDLSFLFFVAAMLVLYGFFIGETHLILIIFSIYISYVVISFFPVNNPIFSFYGLDFYFRLAIFVCFIVVIYILLASFFRFATKGRIGFALLRIICLSVVGSMLFGVFVSSFITNEVGYFVSDISAKYLLDSNWRFLWVVLPLLIIGLKRKKSRNYRDKDNKEEED